ncbi:hypothetical protein Tco_1406341 [Tanacetum coccineum]
MHAKDLVAKPSKDVIMDTEDNTTNDDVFKQPPRPPTPDPEWNKVKAVDDTQEQTWFNDLLSAKKDPLTFDKLMATLIDFSKFAMNHLKIDKLTKAELVGPVSELLKGICQSSIDLEYNMEECYKALTDQLDLKIMKLNRFSKHDVYSPLKIMSVLSVKVNKLHGYGYLEEIMDMLLLIVHHKLFHLNGDVIIDLAVVLRMFTRSLIIKKRVKDVQLGVVYGDLSNQKRLMRADELYKFSDGTLKSVCDTLRHRLLNIHLGYNRDMPRRKWSAMDQRCSGIMVDLIDKQLLERQIIRNLERLVGARELEMDYMLMQRTI